MLLICGLSVQIRCDVTPIIKLSYNSSLRQMDLEMLKRLHRKVNIVLVIAKADTLTASEVDKLKKNILNDIKEHDIQV